MRIESIQIRNAIGARHIDINASAAPITLIAGFNGAGKSSIQEAVRMAFAGRTTRVSLKKDYGQMVSDGAKTGSIMVTTDIGAASFTLPSGAHSLDGDLSLGVPEALPFVLNAQGFAKLKEDDRRTFLFSLTNCTVTEERLRKMLLEAGCDAKRIEQTLPLLKSITGFPAAAKFAAEKATEAKGAWRGVTGETWGSKKAADWTAEKPEVDLDAIDAALKARDELERDMREAQQKYADIKAKANAHDQEVSALATAQQLVEGLPRLRAKLDTDKANLAEVERRIAELKAQAGETPRVGPEHDFARAVEFALDALGDDQRPSVVATITELRAPFDVYVGKYGLPSNTAGDPDARDSLRKYEGSLPTAQSAVRNTEAAITRALAAEERVRTTLSPAIAQGAIDAAGLLVQEIQTAYRASDEKLVALQMVKRKADEADTNTAKAKKHYDDATEWAKLAEQLGADGIPAQLLAQALRPINTELRKFAVTTNWKQPTINADMSITADGRAYNLLCESEQWRVDALIAQAISEISGIKILMLDRVDVLDVEGRVELLTWLAGRADQGEINTALLFATLKQQPSGLPECINAVWLADGTIEAGSYGAEINEAQAA
jgi:hypothetical protein